MQPGASDIAAGAALPGPAVVEVDGRAFSVQLGEPGAPLEVEASTGERVRLLPWRLDEHLRALDRHVDASEQGLRFDHQGLARDVLRRSEVPAVLFDELAPLALWWATGSLREAPSPDGWVRAGTLRARLRPWTLAERTKAVSVSTTVRENGSREFSLERYLREMVSASIMATEPTGQDLASGGAALLDAVVALNTVGGREEDRWVAARGEDGKALAQTTLRLCRALGWTPSQVWATPAPEIDRLLALLDATEQPVQRPAPRRMGLADHPDAVVIQVEDD